MTMVSDALYQFGGVPVGGVLGPLGMGVGKIVHVVVSGSQYEDLLIQRGVSNEDIFTTLATAYAATTASRNDVICVYPGAYDETATLDWTKDNTHLVGMGGPVIKADYSEKNCVIYTDTSAVDYTIDLTGDHCQFINIGINNAGNSATNYAAMRVNGYGNLFLNTSFIGCLGSSQLSAVACGSLAISTNGHNCYFINCVIGEDCWGARSGARSGQLIFSGSQPNGLRFLNCDFRSQSNTTTVAMVRVVPIGVGRDCIFDGCKFSNYGTSNLNQIFASSVNDTTHSWTQISVKDCHVIGVDEWTDHSVDYIYGSMAQATDEGGLVIALDESAS